MSNTVKRSNPIIWLLDPLQSTTERASTSYQYNWSRIAWLLPLGIGVAALVITAVGWATNPQQFYFSYLIGWSFCLSLAIGALFFVLIQHLTGAKWSVVIRRIPEALIWSFPLLAVLGIPILFGMHDLYHWTHHELIDPASASYDPVIAGKAGYLNVPFFIARLAFYFLAWSFLSWRLYTLSVRQDVSGDPTIPAQQRKVSAWGLALTAVTTSFGAFDILMSLDPHWFSTIFGVYFFAGSFMAIMAFMALVAMVLRRAEDVDEGDHVGTLSGSGQIYVRNGSVLGIHSLQPVHAHLVRKYSRGNGFFQAQTRARVGSEQRYFADRTFHHSIFCLDFETGKTNTSGSRLYVRLVARNALV